MIIENWFSVPITYYDLNVQELEEVQKEIKSALHMIYKMDLTNPWQDTVKTSFKYLTGENDNTLKLIDNLNLYKLCEIIIVNSKKFLSSYGLNHDLKITESWINISDKGEFQFSHNHIPHFLSGVYYYQSDLNSGSIEFRNPNRWNELYSFGENSITYEPVVGRLIIFPSYLEHLVHINKTNIERISISFNINSVQSFGSSR